MSLNLNVDEKFIDGCIVKVFAKIAGIIVLYINCFLLHAFFFKKL